MSLVIDGNRSLKWLSAGRRLLDMIRMIDVPAKAIIMDGFIIKAWQDSKLSKIIVKAPMGAAVICSTDSGMQLMTADYWQGGFTPSRDMFVADQPELPLGWVKDSFFLRNEEIGSEKFIPKIQTVLGFTSPPACPVLLPTAAESFWVCVRARTSGLSNIFEICLNFYEGSGKSATRLGYMQKYSDTLGTSAVQLVPSEAWFRVVDHETFDYGIIVDSLGSNYVCGSVATMANDSALKWHIMGSDMWSGMPPALYDLLVNDTYKNVSAAGSYVFSPGSNAEDVFLHGSTVDPLVLNSAWGTSYFYANPGDVMWLVFFSIRKDGVTYTHSLAQFIDILDQMSGGTVIRPGYLPDFTEANRMLHLLFPRPNYQIRAPFDSVMFHSDSDIYTWTRKHGAFKFSPAGLEKVTLAIPPEVVDSVGVRPDITHGGGGEYLCVCTADGFNDAGTSTGVRAVYKGSPFGIWTRLPNAPDVQLVPDGPLVTPKLVHVRPVKVSVEEVSLVGVMEITGADGISQYFFASFFGGGWKKMGKLAVTPGRANWSVCLFGEGKMVSDLKKYPSPPPVLMQMPVLPYSMYDGL